MDSHSSWSPHCLPLSGQTSWGQSAGSGGSQVFGSRRGLLLTLGEALRGSAEAYFLHL